MMDTIVAALLYPQPMTGPGGAGPAEPGVCSYAYAADSSTGEFHRDGDGNTVMVMAQVELLFTDVADNTDLRARLAGALRSSFEAIGAIDPETEVTARWIDAPSPTA